MVPIAVVRKDDNAMSPILQADRSVDNKTLRTTDSKIGVEEDNRPLLFVVALVCHCEGAGRGCVLESWSSR